MPAKNNRLEKIAGKKLVVFFMLALVVFITFIDLMPVSSAAPSWKKQASSKQEATQAAQEKTTQTLTTNVPPQITSISLKPDPLPIDGIIKCSATAFDSNGDSIKITYKWAYTGRCNLSKITSNTIDFSKAECEKEGDIITCIAIPNDGKVDGAPAQQSVVVSSKEFNWEMMGVILAIAGAVIGWLISKRTRSKTARYMTEIDKVYRSYNKNAQKCEAELANLKEKIENDFKKGKINDQALSILEKRIDNYLKELRSDIINRKEYLPESIKKSIKKMLSDGRITKEEYINFKNALSKIEMDSKEKEEIKKLMKKWKEEDKK